jgi:glycosyltransferase involved in cell wall biosynthesis
LASISKHIKSILPNHWKYPFWFLFKSPQRDIGWHTLANDLKGIGIYLKSNLTKPKEFETVSICTGIYNRSEHYLNTFLMSINKLQHQNLIELSVYDCGSTDVADLEKEIRKRWSGKLVFYSEKIPFTRSYSFNKAVIQCSGSRIFLCDADMSIPTNFVVHCHQYVKPGVVWFPICYFLYRDKQPEIKHGNGEWAQYESHGMLGCMRNDFINIGKLNENFTTWGGEDNDLWKRFHQDDFVVIRNRERGLFHHWHETHNRKFVHLNKNG